MSLSSDPYLLVVYTTTVACMSVLQEQPNADLLPETVYVVTKKLGVRPRQQIVVTSEDTARQWLTEKIEIDRDMDDFDWYEYDKTVAESADGEVYGHFQEVSTSI